MSGNHVIFLELLEEPSHLMASETYSQAFGNSQVYWDNIVVI